MNESNLLYAFLLLWGISSYGKLEFGKENFRCDSNPVSLKPKPRIASKHYHAQDTYTWKLSMSHSDIPAEQGQIMDYK